MGEGFLQSNQFVRCKTKQENNILEDVVCFLPKMCAWAICLVFIFVLEPIIKLSSRKTL